jgi:hypothetical protein
VSLALHRKSVVQLPFYAKVVEKRHPGLFSLPAILEGLSISNHDQRVAGSRQQDVKSLWSCHKSDIGRFIAACEGGNDDIALLSLIIICCNC